MGSLWLTCGPFNLCESGSVIDGAAWCLIKH